MRVYKVGEGRPHIVDMIKNGEIRLIVNTTEGRKAIADSGEIRRAALQYKVTYATTAAGAWAMCQAMSCHDAFDVHCLQQLHEEIEA